MAPGESSDAPPQLVLLQSWTRATAPGMLHHLAVPPPPHPNTPPSPPRKDQEQLVITCSQAKTLGAQFGCQRSACWPWSCMGVGGGGVGGAVGRVVQRPASPTLLEDSDSHLSLRQQTSARMVHEDRGKSNSSSHVSMLSTIRCQRESLFGYPRKTTAAECNCPVKQQQLLAIVEALHLVKCYLMSIKQTNRSLTRRQVLFLQTQPVLSRRQACWSHELQWLNFNCVHGSDRAQS